MFEFGSKPQEKNDMCQNTGSGKQQSFVEQSAVKTFFSDDFSRNCQPGQNRQDDFDLVETEKI